MYGDPGPYKCYALTSNDLSYAKLLRDQGYNETMAETLACESHFGNVHSMGIKEFLPGCGKCLCCGLRKSGMQLYFQKIWRIL